MSDEIRIEKFCPNCGAPVRIEKDHCEHCDAFLPGIAKYKHDHDIRLIRETIDAKKAKAEMLEKKKLLEEKAKADDFKRTTKAFLIYMFVSVIILILLYVFDRSISK